MAELLQQQILEAAARLVRGVDALALTTFVERDRALDVLDLPAAVITLDETSEQRGLGGPSRIVESVGELVVELRAQAIEGGPAEVRRLALEVQLAIAADGSLGGLVKYAAPTGLAVEVDESGDQPVTVSRQSFELLWYWQLNAPGVAL